MPSSREGRCFITGLGCKTTPSGLPRRESAFCLAAEHSEACGGHGPGSAAAQPPGRGPRGQKASGAATGQPPAASGARGEEQNLPLSSPGPSYLAKPLLCAWTDAGGRAVAAGRGAEGQERSDFNVFINRGLVHFQPPTRMA